MIGGHLIEFLLKDSLLETMNYHTYYNMNQTIIITLCEMSLDRKKIV